MSSGTYLKKRTGAHPDFFAAEAAGLAWLAAGGGRVVDVVDVGADFIELARLESARPTAAAAREFGGMLARVHGSGAPRFGSAPDGFDGQLFIGARAMSNRTHETWGAFYAAERVLPFLGVAVDAGNVTASEAAVVERACAVIATGAGDDGSPAARIHGDLWSGNVFYAADVVMIDPAAHGGHRETDLAMLALFGCAHLDEILIGYRGEHALADGWEERVPMHQLHPLAVHAAGHGRSYGVALHDAAVSTLALLG